MYEALVKRLRNCTSDTVEDCAGCPYQGGYKGTYCMNGLIDEAAGAIEELTAKVESLQFFVDNISKLPDCNTCMKKHMCEFVPKLGEYCRINCPAWLGAPEPPKEE